MAMMKKVVHAIDVADRYSDGIRLLIDDWGDSAKWQSFPTGEELGGYISRVSQIVQLSYYATELALKVMYQQDWWQDFKGSRDHPLVEIFNGLKEDTRNLIDLALDERENTDVHGGLFKYPTSSGTATDVLAVCDKKYNVYRYVVFEQDNIEDLTYDFAIIDVLRALVIVAKTREETIMRQVRIRHRRRQGMIGLVNSSSSRRRWPLAPRPSTRVLRGHPVQRVAQQVPEARIRVSRPRPPHDSGARSPPPDGRLWPARDGGGPA